jgi:hypothetical protein
MYVNDPAERLISRSAGYFSNRALCCDPVADKFYLD